MDNSGDIILVPDKVPGRGKKWLWIILAVLVLVGGGVAAFLLLGNGEEKAEEDGGIPEQGEQEDEGPSEIEKEKAGRAQEIGFALLETAKEIAGANEDVFVKTSHDGIAYKTVNSEFFAYAKQGLSIDMAWSNENGESFGELATEAVIEKLESFDLREEVFNGMDESYRYYVDLGTVCQIGRHNLAYLSFGCSNMKDYTETFAVLKPFYEAMMEGRDKDDGLTVLHEVTVSDSFVTPYQRAKASVGHVNDSGAVAQWYRTSSNGKWVYFTAAQDTIACEEYSSAGLKRAFAGDFCYDEANHREMMVMP